MLVSLLSVSVLTCSPLNQQVALCSKMVASGRCLLFTLFLITLSHISHSSEVPSENARWSQIRSSTTSTDSMRDPETGLTFGSHRRRHWSREDQDSAGPFSRRPVVQPEDDGPSLEGLSPVRLEMGPGSRMKAGGRDEGRGPAHMQRGSPPPEGEFTRKGRRQGHLAEHRKHGGRKDKGRPKGKRSRPYSLKKITCRIDLIKSS